MVFEPQTLPPGPGTGAMAAFQRRPFQLALTGSRVSIRPPLAGIMICASSVCGLQNILTPVDKSYRRRKESMGEGAGKISGIFS